MSHRAWERDPDDERDLDMERREWAREEAMRPRVSSPCFICAHPTWNPPFCCRHWGDETAHARWREMNGGRP